MTAEDEPWPAQVSAVAGEPQGLDEPIYIWVAKDRHRAALQRTWEELWAAGKRDWLAPYLCTVEGAATTCPLSDWLARSDLMRGGRGQLLIATAGDDDVAFALRLANSIDALWVRPDMRRRGVGGALVRRTQVLAQAVGYPYLVIERPIGNRAALAFSRALGFREARHRAVVVDGQRVRSALDFILLARRYAHTRFVRVTVVIGVALFTYMTVLSAATNQPLPISLFFLTAVLLSAANMLWTERVLWTDADGIYTGYGDGRLRHLPWSALQSLREGGLSQTITIRTANRRDQINIDPYYADVGLLLAAIRLAHGDLWRKTGRREFRRGLAGTMVLLVWTILPWVLLVLSLAWGNEWSWWWLALLPGLGGYPLYLLLTSPFTLRIEDDRLRLRYAFREVVVEAAAIRAIGSEATSALTGQAVNIALLLQDGRRIVLRGFEGDVGEVLNSLRAWRRRASPDTPDEEEGDAGL